MSITVTFHYKCASTSVRLSGWHYEDETDIGLIDAARWSFRHDDNTPDVDPSGFAESVEVERPVGAWDSGETITKFYDPSTWKELGR